MNHHPHVPLLSCTQHLRLGCGFLKDRMSFVLNNPMHNSMFILDLEHETSNTPLRIITSFSLISSEKLGAQQRLEHFDYHYTCMRLYEQLVNERHFVFHHCDGSIGMSIVQGNEEVFPPAHLDLYGFKMVIGVRFSLGGIQGFAFQRPMK